MAATGSIVVIIIYLALMSGFWIGLMGLWRRVRGAAWWIMATGLLFNMIGPPSLAVGVGIIVNHFAVSFSGAPAPPPSSSGDHAAFIIQVGALLTLLGLLLSSVGFALHGFKVARVGERIGELEQLTGAMSEEITRLKEGRALA